MKNLNLASNIGRLLAVSALSVVSAMSFASVSNAQTTGTQTVTVNISGLLQIQAPNAFTTSFDPNNSITPAQLNPSIGNVLVRSNQKNGYTISVTGNGVLSSGTDQLPYKLSTNTITGNPAQGTTVATPITPSAINQTLYTSKTFALENCAQNSFVCGVNVNILFNETDIRNLPGGIALTDTLTYTVLAQ